MQGKCTDFGKMWKNSFLLGELGKRNVHRMQNLLQWVHVHSIYESLSTMILYECQSCSATASLESREVKRFLLLSEGLPNWCQLQIRHLAVWGCWQQWDPDSLLQLFREFSKRDSVSIENPQRYCPGRLFCPSSAKISAVRSRDRVLTVSCFLIFSVCTTVGR